MGRRGTKGKACAMAQVGLIFMLVFVLFPAGLITFLSPPIENALDLQLHLIFECKGESDGIYQLSYSWSATGIDEGSPSVKLAWSNRKASAVGVTVDPIHQAIKIAFSEINILDDSLRLASDGSWNLDISKQVHQHVRVGIDARGQNDTISYLDVYSDLSLFPWSLKTALSDFGIEAVDLKAKVVLRIDGPFISRLITNVGLIVQFYADLIMETLDILLGTIDI